MKCLRTGEICLLHRGFVISKTSIKQILGKRNEILWYLGTVPSLIILHLLFNLQIVYSDFHSDGGASKLSPYLRFGCLSPRTLYHSLSETYLKVCHFIFF